MAYDDGVHSSQLARLRRALTAFSEYRDYTRRSRELHAAEIEGVTPAPPGWHDTIDKTTAEVEEVMAFIDDIERFMSGIAVPARDPSGADIMAKWVHY